MEFMECLNEDAKKKMYIEGRAVLIATNSNLLDTKYEFYGFNDDLRNTINSLPQDRFLYEQVHVPLLCVKTHCSCIFCLRSLILLSLL